MLIRRCVYENINKDEIHKLFPAEASPEMQRLLTLLLQKFHSEWQEDIQKERGTLPRFKTMTWDMVSQEGELMEPLAVINLKNNGYFTYFVLNMFHSFKVAVAMPNLDELLKDTPTHIFASVWLDWKKTKFYSTHFSELVRLASLYKYGGIYLDSDIVVLQPLSSLNNTVGLENEHNGSNLNGAVMAFRKHSPFIWDCLTEFYATYDDTLVRWNGAELLTRVGKSFLNKASPLDKTTELKLQPSFAFFPISHDNITRAGHMHDATTHNVYSSLCTMVPGLEFDKAE
ncbi:hypothetical protein POM88_020258 [Heracleum sosnowskyi]|uniref:Alpha 1,4-glycosyltransferase domain-containing protein n=1 Tax=Heracleum sosnowskyi TaxID=360622 RepID=A0AAD8IC79_9APIA|nr:hypothetical protein POM88_033123 [Heracleum sosnowskyi]KAK1382523.1 hypothetical protein POM88_020258 [Heracleum sosnowskyi]